MEIVALFFILPLIPLVLMFIGFLKLSQNDEKARAQGKTLFLTGFIIVVLALLIGFSICSGGI